MCECFCMLIQSKLRDCVILLMYNCEIGLWNRSKKLKFKMMSTNEHFQWANLSLYSLDCNASKNLSNPVPIGSTNVGTFSMSFGCNIFIPSETTQQSILNVPFHWCKEATFGKVPTIVQPIEEKMVAFTSRLATVSALWSWLLTVKNRLCHYILATTVVCNLINFVMHILLS